MLTLDQPSAPVSMTISTTVSVGVGFSFSLAGVRVHRNISFSHSQAVSCIPSQPYANQILASLRREVSSTFPGLREMPQFLLTYAFLPPPPSSRSHRGGHHKGPLRESVESICISSMAVCCGITAQAAVTMVILAARARLRGEEVKDDLGNARWRRFAVPAARSRSLMRWDDRTGQGQDRRFLDQ